MTELQKMLRGELYNSSDSEIKKLFNQGKDYVYAFNKTTYADKAERTRLLTALLGAAGEKCRMTPPIYFDYGVNTYIGKNFYANTNLVILDVTKVEIGDNVMFGPNVALYTATHPIDATLRNSGLEYGKRIKIGNNVWLGGNVVVNPGVTIGDNVVIGAGSVVTKDIPANTLAYGNPCRVVKKI